MAYADGEFTENEKQFISQVIEDNVSDVDTLLENKLDIPAEEKDRMTILYYLLFLLKIDGVVAPSERKIAQKFGVALGFRSEMIISMLDVMEDHLENKLPDEELITIIRQYLN
jgi:hypothetical protein